MSAGTLEFEARILQLCIARGLEKSVCPSEVARALVRDSEEWRPLMPSIRAVAADLHRRGEIRVLQGGSEIEPEAVAGPIRLALAQNHLRED